MLKFNNKVIVIGLVLILGLMLTGCGHKATELEVEKNNKGILKVVINNSNSPMLQSVSDDITIAKYKFTISKENVTKSQEIDATETAVIFNNLEVGNWTVEVTAVDTYGYDCYGGNSIATVMKDATTTSAVELYLLKGNLTLSINIPTGYTSGEAILLNHFGGSNVTKSLTINGEVGSVTFIDLQAGTWDIKINLSNSNETISGIGTFNVLPGRENSGTVTFNTETGEINIAINIHLTPADPTGLSATENNGSVDLSWTANSEANIAGYLIYRSKNQSGIKDILNQDLVTGTTYNDTTIIPGETYYYWIRAYNNDGYSSDFSNFTEITISNSSSSSVEMVIVPLGTTSADNGSITLDHDIKIGKYEVTHAEFIEFLNDAAVSSDGTYQGKTVINIDNSDCGIAHDGTSFSFVGSNIAANENCPVIFVTWYGAVAYCNWLSEQEGLIPAYDLNSWELISSDKSSLEGYRLPSENEWEYAARGGANGDATTYAGSDTLDDVAWTIMNSLDNGYCKPHQGGLKAANELGIYDMSGNVSEWTNTLVYGSSYAIRGGSWGGGTGYCEVGVQFYRDPSGGDSSNSVGFRLTRTNKQ